MIFSGGQFVGVLGVAGFCADVSVVAVVVAEVEFVDGAEFASGVSQPELTGFFFETGFLVCACGRRAFDFAGLDAGCDGAACGEGDWDELV